MLPFVSGLGHGVSRTLVYTYSYLKITYGQGSIHSVIQQMFTECLLHARQQRGTREQSHQLDFLGQRLCAIIKQL